MVLLLTCLFLFVPLSKKSLKLKNNYFYFLNERIGIFQHIFLVERDDLFQILSFKVFLEFICFPLYLKLF